MAQFEDANIMSEEEAIALFADDGGGSQEPENKEPEDGKQPEDENGKEKPAEENQIDLNNPFNVPENPESVGSEGNKNTEGKENTPAGGNSSPIYSSLAKALAEEGILFDSDTKIEEVKDAKSLVEALHKSVLLQLDEEQKRVATALNNNVEPNVIKGYENTIKQLNSITDKQLDDESEQAENLRKNIIYRDFINKGFSEQRAQREVERAIANGTDKEDAKEALQSIKDTIQAQYNQALDKAQQEEDAVQADRKKQAADLRKGVLEDNDIFGGLEIDKTTRQKILDNIIKPVYKDPDTGDMLTAIQKYEAENRVDFLKKIGVIYTLTDGFKSLDGLVKGKVRKEVKKGIQELENVINNTQRNSDGSLAFAGGVSTPDNESYFNSLTLDI